MTVLSPSILSANFGYLADDMNKAVEGGCDYFHFDVMDGMFVPNISFGIPVLESVRKVTGHTLDVHLMVNEPQRYVDRFIDAGADIVTVHYEACEPLLQTLCRIHERGKKAGIAIKPHTDISVLKPFLDLADMFLIMTVEPGFGGQKYMDMCTGKIKGLRKILNDKGLSKDIEVDGGITRENVTCVLDAGANVIVMGSSVFKGDIKDNASFFRQLFDKYDKGERS